MISPCLFKCCLNILYCVFLVSFDIDDMFPLYLTDECFMRLHVYLV